MAAATHFVITGTAAYVAGASHTVTITAKDGGGVTDTTYTGDKTITFSGANNAPDGTTHPTVADKTSVARNFGVAETITFTSGVASGALILVKAETALINATDGTLTATGFELSVVVTAGTVTKLILSGSANQAAGIAQTVTIRATDALANTDLTYTGDKSLTWSGANLSTGSVHPTATDKVPAAINFGSVTTTTFTIGVATSSVVLVKDEVAVVAVTDGSHAAAGADRLSVTVSAIVISSLPHGSLTILPLQVTSLTGTVSAGAVTYSIVSGLASVDASGNITTSGEGTIVARVTSVIDTAKTADITITVSSVTDSGASVISLTGRGHRYIQHLLTERKASISAADPFRQTELVIINEALASLINLQ